MRRWSLLRSSALLEQAKELRPTLGDVAGAQEHDDVASAGISREGGGQVATLATPGEASAGAGNVLFDQRRRDAGNGPLTRWINLREVHCVRGGERLCEVAREVARAREEMR